MAKGKGFAERLIEAQERTGITNRRLAEVSGAHINTVSKWRSGVQRPDATAVDAIARELGVTTTLLLHGAAHVVEAPQIGYGQVNPIGGNILAMVAEEAELLGALERAAELIRHRLKRLHDAR